MRTLRKPYLCIPQIARMVGGAHPTTIPPPRARIHEQSWAVPTLQQFVRPVQEYTNNGARCAPYTNTAWEVEILKGWCAVRTLHKPYLCIPQIARMVGGAHPTTIPPPRARIHEQWCAVRTLHKHSLRSRNTKKRLVRRAHPTQTLPLHSADSKDGGRCPPYEAPINKKSRAS